MQKEEAGSRKNFTQGSKDIGITKNPFHYKSQQSLRRVSRDKQLKQVTHMKRKCFVLYEWKNWE